MATPAQAPNLTQFHPFPNLPTELRLAIWKHALETESKARVAAVIPTMSQDHRVIPTLGLVSPLLTTNGESRAQAKAFYSTAIPVYRRFAASPAPPRAPMWRPAGLLYLKLDTDHVVRDVQRSDILPGLPPATAAATRAQDLGDLPHVSERLTPAQRREVGSVLRVPGPRTLAVARVLLVVPRRAFWNVLRSTLRAEDVISFPGSRVWRFVDGRNGRLFRPGAVDAILMSQVTPMWAFHNQAL